MEAIAARSIFMIRTCRLKELRFCHGNDDARSLCRRRRRAERAAGQGEAPAGTVAGQTPVARGPCEVGAPYRRAGAVLRIRRAQVFPLGWGARANRRSPTGGV